MAVAARYTKVWIDEFDFSGDSFSATIAMTSPVVETTTFQASAKTWQVIFPEATVSQSGYIVGVADTDLEKNIKDRLGSSSTHHVSVLYGTNTAGCPAYVIPGTAAKMMQIQAPVEGVLSIMSEWTSGTGVKRGKRVADEAITATGALTGVDLGAQGTTGGVAYLFVRSITGTASSATIKVQSASASNFSSPADEGTFTFSGVGSYAVNLSGTIGRYVRVNVTDLGGATGFTVGAVVCVNGVTQ